MAQRGSLFEEELELDDFAPAARVATRDKAQPKPEKKPSKTAPAARSPKLEKMAEKEGFTPRTPRRSRRRRTGRTEQLNIKVSAEILGEFYRIADQQNWVLGEVLEYALPALVRELDAKEKG